MWGGGFVYLHKHKIFYIYYIIFLILKENYNVFSDIFIKAFYSLG